MSSFLLKTRPTVVGMLRSNTTEDLLKEISLVLKEGADAVGFQIEALLPKERCAENYNRIIAAMEGRPAYVTHYARCNTLDLSDDELMKELFAAAECGATLIDVRCDLFDRRPDEYSTDHTAIKKQREVISRLHDMGAEVLMSTHLLKYAPCEKVVEIALSQQSRGADIVKIVTDASSDEELCENLKTSVVLKEALDVPSLFLCNGTHCKKHRMLGPVLGSCMFLAVENSNTDLNQPPISKAREMLSLVGYEL